MTHDADRRSGRIRLVLVGATAELVVDSWREFDLEVESVSTIGEAVRELTTRPPDAVILLASNVQAPELCSIVRPLGHFVIGVLPEPLTESAAIDCLERGADFALTAPSSVAEIIVRLRAAVHRNARDQRVIVTDDVRIDLARREITRSGVRVPLTDMESRVLGVLARRIGEVVPATELLHAAWGEAMADELHYVRLYIGYLRKKLEVDPAHPRLILTHRSEGYELAQI